MEPETLPITVEELLAHQTWVRGLARALVRDEHEADDLAQEAWVRALRSPPTHPGAIRTWFRRVIGNLWKNRLRSMARTTARERAVARPEGVDLARGAVERAEMHRRVVAAVLRLDPPYRETLVLRFFEGLTAAEISVRSGTPAATVRSRQARGLEMLRERLDRESGGDGRRWRALVLPLLVPPSGRTGGVASLAAAEGVLIMSGKVKAVLAVVVIALLGAGAVTLGVFQKQPATPDPVRAAAPDPEDDMPVVVDEAPAPEERDAAAGESPGREFRVIVRDPEGRPVSGAEVFVLSVEKRQGIRTAPAPGEGAGVLLAKHLTGEDGRLTTFAKAKKLVLPDNVISDFRPFIRLKAVAGGLVAWSPGFRTTKATPAEIELILAPAVSLGGRVIDEEGAPIEGAAVSFHLSFVEGGHGHERLTASASGPDGSFLLVQVPEAPRISRLIVAAKGCISQGLEVDFEQDPASGIEVVLSRGLSVRGRCVDEAGRPLAGVLVRAPYSHVRTGRDGVFELSVIPPREPHVRFVAPGREEKLVRLRKSGPQPQDLGDVALLAGLEVRGDVVSGEGKPLAGVEVTLSGQDPSGAMLYRDTKTDENGAFHFADLSDGKYTVGARGEPVAGSAYAAFRDSRRVTPEDSPVRLVLDAAGSVLLSFFSAAEREPLTLESIDLRLTDEPHTASGTMMMSGRACRTIRLKPRAPGMFTLVVRARGYEEVVVKGVDVRVDRETKVEVLLQTKR